MQQIKTQSTSSKRKHMAIEYLLIAVIVTSGGALQAFATG